MSGKKYRGLLAGLVFLAAMPFGTVRLSHWKACPAGNCGSPT